MGSTGWTVQGGQCGVAIAGQAVENGQYRMGSAGWAVRGGYYGVGNSSLGSPAVALEELGQFLSHQSLGEARVGSFPGESSSQGHLVSRAL